MECCDPRGCDQMFGAGFARHLARRYRNRGLDRTGRHVVAFLEQQGIEGASVLEVGGGLGEIPIELLRRGAAHATNLELSPAYEDEADRLVHAAGLTGRVTRVLADIAVSPDATGPADVVVLHRVVCCYPDYEALLAAAADHTGRLLVFSHPPRNAVSRVGFTVLNAFFGLSGRTYRAFTHSPEAMVDVLRARGLEPIFKHSGPWWRVVGLARSTA